MSSPGIYVELPIKTTLDALWEYTQNPSYHEQWDLRFTSIEYLPKLAADAPQQFLYTTQIGFGIKVAGKGESTGTRHAANGESSSALKFWSGQPISLIRVGSGYWKYIPHADTIRFLTWYDYQVRFGILGRGLDRYCFRPLLGWATAWRPAGRFSMKCAGESQRSCRRVHAGADVIATISSGIRFTRSRLGQR